MNLNRDTAGMQITDSPVSKKVEDRLQRYNFAARIATIVATPKIARSLIIGLYGKWGEGKTSVMQFIQNELPKETVIVKFNPWLFTDEQHLIKSFFASITAALGEKDKSLKEKIGGLLSDYGEAIGVITQFAGFSTDGLEKLGNKLKVITTEQLKKRVDNLIIKSGKNIVVFVDDIDRLDILEVQFIFKLIKLVGDFPRTCYLLSFDEEMVAAALAPKYGGSQSTAGYNFLEKIIQLPIKIPKASKKSIHKYSIELIGNILENNFVKLSEEEKKEFLDIFDNSILPSIDNLRQSIRLANSLSFSLPLLKGEVHSGNLIVLECLKILYPELFDFLRSNAHIVLLRTNNVNGGKINKEEIIQSINTILNVYTSDKRKAALDVIEKLFPQLQNVFRNTSYSDQIYERWTLEKKICSRKYFDRYFSYTVEEGDIPDNYFEKIMEEIGTTPLENLITILTDAIKQYSPFDLIIKFRQQVEYLDAVQSENLAMAITKVGHSLPYENDIHISTTYAQSANLVAKLIRNVSAANQLKLTLKLLSEANTLEYAMELHYWLILSISENTVKIIFSKEQQTQIEKHLVTRFLAEMNNNNFFTLLSDTPLSRILIWWNRWQEKENILKEFLFHKLGAGTNWEFALRLLKVFTPTISSFISSGENSTYKGSLSEKNYITLRSILDVQLLNKNLISKFEMKPYLQSFSSISEIDPMEDKDLVSVFQGYIEKTGKS